MIWKTSISSQKTRTRDNPDYLSHMMSKRFVSKCEIEDKESWTDVMINLGYKGDLFLLYHD